MFNFNGFEQTRQQRGPVNTTKFYELLEIEKNCPQEDIKKAFRKAAMRYHPDKGGDPEKFKEIQRAYEVLNDPDKRAVYDEGGEEALSEGPGGSGPGDIFDLFGMGGGGRRGGGGNRKRRGEDVVFNLAVELADLYSGATKKLRVTKNVLCKDCNGKGGEGVSRCADCKGQGARTVLRQLGPGMMQQMHVQCPSCQGQGTIIPESGRCKVCKGDRVTKEQKTLEVYVAPGMKDKDKVVFQGEADEGPDTVPGDVVVVLEQKPHPVFKREGQHLFMKKTLLLAEALVGFEFTVEHLDGRVLVVKSSPDVVYKPRDFKVVRDEGMPSYKTAPRGHLYVEFQVEFPAPGFLDEGKKKKLAKLLPRPVANAEPQEGEVEDVSLVEVDLEQERRRWQEEERAQREQDDDEGPRTARCQTQ